MVSGRVLTATPLETPLRVVLAIRLVAWLRAASLAIAAALLAAFGAGVARLPARAAGLAAVVPATALVDWVPLTAPPVLTKISSRISGLCQYFGASSMTTWDWLSGVEIVSTFRCATTS